MAVLLRCPDCRHPVRLKVDPEPDSEMECPECKATYPVDDNIVRAGGADDDEPPKKKKKKPAADGGGEKPKKKKEKEPPPAGEQPPKRKKRKSKKRKTPPVVLAGIILGALMMIGTVAGTLIWFFTKKSASQEMMTYLPDDCDEVFGLNLGHLQKYPEFYKSCESTFAAAGFKQAGDVFAKAIGQEFNDAIEYVVYGSGKAGGKPDGQALEATVLRTKAEYDQAAISKIPGAKEYTASGVKYYTVPDLDKLGYPGLRVFAPTNRIVVFCRGDMPDAKFKAMLEGNKDNLDATPFVRAGALAKQTIRGTVWKFIIYGRGSTRPAAPPPPKSEGGTAGGQPSDEDQLKGEVAGIASSAKGSGYKASVGSREVRGEWIVWYGESSKASDEVKKWKEKDWVKDDEKDQPKWWKALAQKSGGGKTAPNVLKDNLGFSSSGELFSIRTAMDTKMIGQGVSSIVGAFSPQTPGSGAGGGGMPGPPGGGGGAPAGPGGVVGPGGGVPLNRRRRVLARR